MSTRFLNRRGFLGQANCALISALPIMNTLLNLRLAGSAAAAGARPATTRRSSVSSSAAATIPSTCSLRAARPITEYAGIRQSIALPENQLLPINPIVDPGVR